MNIAIGCEFSGIVREAFTKHGHWAVSIDLLDTEIPGTHFKTDIIEFLKNNAEKFDLFIGFPPCTHLAVSGARWFKNKQQEQKEAIEFIKQLWQTPIPKIAIENPISILSTQFRKPDQIIQPWMFGHGETKATCLWLKNLPKLQPTKIVTGREGRIWKEPPNPDRWKNRSRTYPGIAEAMATQWGNINDSQISLSHTLRKQATHPHPLKPIPQQPHSAKTVSYYPLISELDDQP